MFFFLGICFLLLKKYRPSKFIIMSVLYIGFIIIMSFINKTDRADYHLIVSNAKMLTYMGVVEWSLRKDTERAVNTLFGVLLVYVLMDFASIVLFPGGLYFKETVWNEWSTSRYAQWIFGNKNNHGYWYLSLLLLGCWKWNKNRTLRGRTIIVMLMGMSMLAMLLLNSATSTVVILTAVIGIWLGMFSGKETILHLNPRLIYPGFLAVEALWVTGNVTFLTPIIEGLLGRTMTFTNRTTIWGRAILYIIQKPFFGWGWYGTKATTLLGNQAYVNVHNQILDVLWQGGICGLVLFSLLILTITRSIGRITGNKKNVMMVFLLGAILVEMLAETIMGVDTPWLYLLMCYHFANRIADDEAYHRRGTVR